MRYFFIGVIVFMASFAFGDIWQDSGFDVIFSTNIDNTLNLKVSVGNIKDISIKYNIEVPDDVLKKMIDNIKMFAGWNNIKISHIRCIAYTNGFEAVVIVSSLKYKGRELATYMPAGMSFFYRGMLMYDFRMVSGDISMKIKGIFINKEELLKKMYSAIANPVLYVRRSNPDYIISKIEEYDKQFDMLKKEMYIQKTNMQAKIDALQDKYTKLKKAFELLRYAVMTLHNTGFLRGPRKISRHLIKEVLTIKKSRPKLNAEQITDILEKRGMEVDEDEVCLILAAFYGEFDD